MAAVTAITLQQTSQRDPNQPNTITASAEVPAANTSKMGLETLLHRAPLNGASKTAGAISRAVTRCHAPCGAMQWERAASKTTNSRSALSASTRATCEPHSDTNRRRAPHTRYSPNVTTNPRRYCHDAPRHRQPAQQKSPRTAVRGLFLVFGACETPNT